MRKKLAVLALAVFLIAGIYSVAYMSTTGVTYDGSHISALDIYLNPQDYDNSNADGIGGIIVNETIDKTYALNAVTAVVFDFRGYDTLGEAFILLAAITGALAILRKSSKRRDQ